jgi:hypothetical protein
MPRPRDWADVDEKLARLLKQDGEPQEEPINVNESSQTDNLSWDSSDEETRNDLSAIEEDHSGELP